MVFSSVIIAHFVNIYVFLKVNRVLALVLTLKSGKFQLTRGQGERSRRHAVFAVCFSLLCRLLVGLWLHDQWATALSGRGSFAFIV